MDEIAECPSPEYLAGFFDGEGCVFFETPHVVAGHPNLMTRARVTVTIGNTYHPIVQAIHKKYGGSLSDSRGAKDIEAGKRPFIAVHLKGREAAHFLTDILPFLREKRGRANAALFALDSQVWPRSGKSLSPEAVRLREIAMRYARQNPNGKGNKKGGAPKGAGRPPKTYIFNSAISAAGA